jgi:glycosyltransferase involved in cell wall biosynthesis
MKYMKNPKVSIGLPVYNGEKYLAQAIQSALKQTFTDFELIISDNASTDGTQAICEHYAALDERIQYHRLPENQGATWNFNHVFGLGNGEYFCWLAHDDQLAPDYLQEFVHVLESHPDSVLSYSNVSIIDENDAPITEFDVTMRTNSDKPSQRFYDLLMVWHDCYAIFGLIRASALHKTPLIGAYSFGDSVLLARLGLMGKFHHVEKPLFISRSHSQQSNRMFNVWVDHHAYDRWFITRAGKIHFPQWEVLFDHIYMVRAAPVSLVEKVLCCGAIVRWSIRYRSLLIKDCVIALKTLWKRTRLHPDQQRISGN